MLPAEKFYPALLPESPMGLTWYIPPGLVLICGTDSQGRLHLP